MSYKFTSGEVLTADKLNQAISGRRLTVHGSGGSSIDADGDTIRVDGYENIYIRLTEKQTANSTVKYGWKEVYRTANGAWQNATFNGTANGDYAVEINNANLPTGNIVYRAERSPESGELLFRSSGLLSTDIKGKDIVLMILGTEEEYDTCANAPAASPGCWQGYAWAAYKVCGYTYTKLFDARDLGKWALELNGGTTSAWRRFHPAFWGWDSYTEGLPTAANACEGVRFIGTGASALSCSCPDWVSDVDCLKIEFNTTERPEDPQECSSAVNHMDNHDEWDKAFSQTLCRAGCTFSGTTANNTFTIDIDFAEIPRTDPECFWGPATFDPCEPCEAFGRFEICFLVAGGNEPNCGAGCHVTAYFSYSDMKALIENCATGNGTMSITPTNVVMCDGCGNGQSPPEVYYFIDSSSIVLKCCTSGETANCP